MKVIAQGDPIEYEVSDPADACRLYRQDMTAALIGVVTSTTDYERAKRLAESVRLFNEERKRLTAELSLLRSKLEQWVDDIRIGPAIRDDMRAFLNPSADNAYVFCAVHGTAPRSHPFYHDKGIYCATCAEAS